MLRPLDALAWKWTAAWLALVLCSASELMAKDEPAQLPFVLQCVPADAPGFISFGSPSRG